MQVNTNVEVGIDVLKKAIDANKAQVSNLLEMQQKANSNAFVQKK